MTIEELLTEGWVKVGSRYYCTFWKKGDEIIKINEPEDSPVVEAYNKGYEDALRAITVNLEHFKKDVWGISMIYDGCLDDSCMYHHEGESECDKLLKENILGSCK